MRTVSAAEVQKNFGQFRETAVVEGFVLTASGKPSVVMTAYDEFERMKDLDRRVLRLETMADDQLQEIVDAKIPEEFRYKLSDIPDVE